MKPTNIYQIKFSQLQVFLFAAEYESFTAAAEKLHMTQPLVSKVIRNLEDELGIYLFIRAHGKLQLTPAGRSVKKDWQGLVSEFEDSLENAYSMQEGYDSKLRVGTGDLAGNQEWQSELVYQAKKRYPGLTIDLEYHDMAELTRRAINGELDIIITSGHLRDVISNAGLSWDTMQKTNLAIFVHDSNPLFERDTLSFSDLKSERFIVLSPSVDRSYLPLLMKLCQKSGFKPSISCYVPNDCSFKGNLSVGNGIVLADEATGLDNQHIKKFVLEGEYNNVIYAWKPENEKVGLKEFLTVIEHAKMA